LQLAVEHLLNSLATNIKLKTNFFIHLGLDILNLGA